MSWLQNLKATKFRWVTFSLAMLIAAGLISVFLMVEVSSQPDFCGTCHVMTPYYDSWKTSTHKDVACVECHIPPGVAHEVRKKWEALSMVASYFTGTYGTNPWAEIDDAACLRCHERRLLAGQELFGDVVFNHTPHLTELRRGKKLRCTSCHSQIVQGQHIAVTSSTCILCHFKNQDATSRTATCELCHRVPETKVELGLVSFDHGDVKRFDMNCRWCHSTDLEASTQGGEVPRERCVTCHNDPERLKEFGNGDLLHRTHVSEHKVDCLNCHLEIRHGQPPQLESAQTGCEGCHPGGHSPQRDLYAGLGGKGVPRMPAPMFSAGVSCEGCHFQIPGHEKEIAQATEVACMSCHGPRYRSTFHRWKESVDQRVVPLRRQLQMTVSQFPGAEPQSLMDARHNIELVEKGRGSHNIRYAFALLAKGHEFLNDARKGAGLGALPVPWPQSAYQSECLECHQGIEGQSGAAGGVQFEHQKHVVQKKLDCSVCHRSHEEKPAGEVLRFPASGCNDCHHSQTEVECRTCHARVLAGDVVSFRGDFSHEMHLEMDMGCPDCHRIEKGNPVVLEREICSGCHED